MKDNRLLGKLLYGALIGAGFGLAVSWVMANRTEPDGDLGPTAQKLKKPISVNEVIGLGFALLKVARQAADLVRKV
jgi:hypothetical protein